MEPYLHSLIRPTGLESKSHCAGKDQHQFRSLKSELLNSVYKFSSYLTGNTLRLGYKAQPVNAV
jgi:hypothetical protein